MSNSYKLYYLKVVVPNLPVEGAYLCNIGILNPTVQATIAYTNNNMDWCRRNVGKKLIDANKEKLSSARDKAHAPESSNANGNDSNMHKSIVLVCDVLRSFSYRMGTYMESKSIELVKMREYQESMRRCMEVHATNNTVFVSDLKDTIMDFNNAVKIFTTRIEHLGTSTVKIFTTRIEHLGTSTKRTLPRKKDVSGKIVKRYSSISSVRKKLSFDLNKTDEYINLDDDVPQGMNLKKSSKVDTTPRSILKNRVHVELAEGSQSRSCAGQSKSGVTQLNSETKKTEKSVRIQGYDRDAPEIVTGSKINNCGTPKSNSKLKQPIGDVNATDLGEHMINAPDQELMQIWKQCDKMGYKFNRKRLRNHKHIKNIMYAMEEFLDDSEELVTTNIEPYLTRKEIRTLAPDTWLTSPILDVASAILNYEEVTVKKAYKVENMVKLWFFPVFDLESCLMDETAFNAHYVVKRIKQNYVCSLIAECGGLRCLESRFKEEIEETKNLGVDFLDLQEYEIVREVGGQKQNNTFDCGVFVIQNMRASRVMEHIIPRVPFSKMT